MNTQAHLLLAAALLCKSSNVGPNLPSTSPVAERGGWPSNLAVLLGAVLPDISLYVMFAQARLRGIGHDVIWGELYFSEFWQNLGAITNSIPVYVGLAILGYWLMRRGSTQARILMSIGLAAALHCVTDFPLHVDDGHPHFWPFTDWIYSSPVSYWDSNHYGQYWLPIEFLLSGICVAVLWKRFKSLWVRLFALIGLLSYPVMLMFWASSIS